MMRASKGGIMQRYTRSIAELWQFWQPNAKAVLHPMVFTSYEDHQGVFAKLTSLDRDAWAAAYSEAAQPYEARARDAEAKGDARAAKDNYFHAYGLYRMARFPTTNSVGKREAYRKSQEMYLAALRYLPYAFERVEIPFAGKVGEGTHAVGYFVRAPGDTAQRPLVIMWAGIDIFKEDRTEIWQPILAAGFDEWVEFCPQLSLITQGIADQTCASLLLVNGTEDTIFPIEDMYLLLQHGNPKEARFYPVGHMGYTLDTNPTIIRWLAAKLGA
jgi:hypothetical protein